MQEYNLEIGPLNVSFHKTVKVKISEEISNLPPSLGNFEIYKVADFHCPEHWDENGYFISLQDKEAMWLSFQNIEPVAVMVGVGNINAVNGEVFDNKLKKDNYMVTPPQPWLDGWKNENSVYQFVAAEVGENKTVGEQLVQTKNHALTISVFKAKNPEKLKYSMSPCICGFAGEMGIGKGGKIKQKIYEDPYGLDEWKDTPETVNIYLINSLDFCDITGKVAVNYDGPWFNLDDENMKEIQGSTIFDNLETV